MADIFSQILAGLQPEDGSANPYAIPADQSQQAPVNLLQGIAGYDGGDNAPAPVQNQPFNAGGTTNAAPADAATRPARSRSSFLDTIGRISDVLAKVGGANPLYQPTLDARQDRTLSLGDHDRSVAMDKIKLAGAQGELGDKDVARIGAAARGLQAIVAANPQADVSKIWPMLAQQMGVDPSHAAQIGQQLANNPEFLTGLSQPAKGSDYTGQVVYAVGPDGKLAAFQPGNNVAARNILPDGFTPVDPTKAVNLGGTTALVGSRSGGVNRILPNTEAPGKAADRSSRENIAAADRASREQIAADKANSAGKKGGDPYSTYVTGMNSIRQLDDSLNDLVTDPNLPGATGLVGGRLDLTSGQRAIKGKIASLEGQGIPAAIAAIKQSGGASPRAVSEIMGEVKGLIGAIHNRDMPTDAYIASINSARGRLRQRMQEMTDAAVRQGYAVRDSSGRIAPAAPATPVVKPAAAPASGSGGWSIVGVK